MMMIIPIINMMTMMMMKTTGKNCDMFDLESVSTRHPGKFIASTFIACAFSFVKRFHIKCVHYHSPFHKY